MVGTSLDFEHKLTRHNPPCYHNLDTTHLVTIDPEKPTVLPLWGRIQVAVLATVTSWLLALVLLWLLLL